VVGLEENGAAPADLARAAELTFRALERALTAGGATLSDLVRVNVYIEHLDDEKLQIYRRVRDAIIDMQNLPASTVIGVSSLFRGAPIEIDAIAAV
jgi:enamine deaminase RidA (YjgF/YER057c/UK114 family)